MTLNFNTNANLSNMPNMSDTLTSWLIPLTLEKVQQSVVDGYAVKTSTKIDFMGVFQPLKDEQLQFKAEGQRSWEWYWIHAQAGSLNLKTQDKIIFQDKRYKVMSVKDYSLNGFIEYQVIRDYEGE